MDEGADVVVQRFATRLRDHLARIYGDDVADATLPRLVAVLERFERWHADAATARHELFDETDVVLITYGDQVREPDRAPLETLADFLDAQVGSAVSGVHLLPHHPSTSDDGFSVADFSEVDPALGTWQHVEQLGSRRRLMLDAVVNHTSRSHPWFVGWLSCDDRRAGFYLTVDPSADLRSVTRPRTSPLLTPVHGDRWVWSTFSADQMDLDYANPDVLLAVTEVLLSYVAHGASRLRLDAVAFLWKRQGTTCMHLPETHEIIRLWRTVLDAVAPGTLIVTETNVPHRENLTYFGSGDDEAHLVYQFALPPLTLGALHRGDAGRMTQWARGLQAPSDQTTFLNFLASHDGIGLRPVEGLLPDDEIAEMCAAVVGQGGRISYREVAGAAPRPYELNCVYLDALARPGDSRQTLVDRFVVAHSILLSLAGVPAVYFQSLFGSRNWVEGADHTGRHRVINRQRFARATLESQLADRGSLRRQVRDRLLDRIGIRTGQPAFHPNADQTVVDSDPAYFAVQRTPHTGDTSLLCVHDVSGRGGRFRARPPDRLGAGARMVDLADGAEYVAEADGTVDVDVPAYGVRWLRARSAGVS